MELIDGTGWARLGVTVYEVLSLDLTGRSANETIGLFGTALELEINRCIMQLFTRFRPQAREIYIDEYSLVGIDLSAVFHLYRMQLGKPPYS